MTLPKDFVVGPKPCDKCGKDFTASGSGAHLRKFCYTCSPSKKYIEKNSYKQEGRFCQLDGCKKKIPIARHGSAKYCSHEHTEKAQWIKQSKKQQAEREANALFRNPDTESRVAQERQGDTYRRLKDDPLTLEELLNGSITASAVAVTMGVSTAAVTRSMHAILAERAVAQQRAKWSRSRFTQAMLPKDMMDEVRKMGLSGQTADPRFDELVDALVRAYSIFSKRFFNLEGRRPLIKKFHIKWIRSIIVAYATGGKQLILSPPRHGKSETLIRFVVWFICMDPNIRIGWFCASRDVATLMLGAVKDILENNQELIRAVLPPGELFDPGLKSGRPWSMKEIKVAQQSHIGAKSSSMLALGRTSKFLSRDMDVLIIDDLEDYDSTREESQRVYSRNKLAEIGTRKVEETAEIAIGSRQHPDDIPSHLLALEGSILQWEVIVDSAHDEDCGEDPDDFTAHWDCMLFPEVRSYRYLMEKKMEMETLGLGHLYPLRYLNIPIPPEGQVFDVETIREVALNRERGLGLEGLPLGYLVGGLDPSARGIQASWLWHYREDEEFGVKMAMVDSDTEQSGGVAGAAKIIVQWYKQYGVVEWFYETNSQQAEFYKLVKERVAKIMEAEYGLNPINIKEHSTGKNKQDAELGISAMAPLYHSGAIDLPYGTNEARRKVNALLRQLELWTTDGVQNKHAKTDIKMAQWFPFVGKIQSFIKKKKHLRLNISEDSSYAGIETFSATPWETRYPGGS